MQQQRFKRAALAFAGRNVGRDAESADECREKHEDRQRRQRSGRHDPRGREVAIEDAQRRRRPSAPRRGAPAACQRRTPHSRREPPHSVRLPGDSVHAASGSSSTGAGRLGVNFAGIVGTDRSAPIGVWRSRTAAAEIACRLGHRQSREARNATRPGARDAPCVDASPSRCRLDGGHRDQRHAHHQRPPQSIQEP